MSLPQRLSRPDAAQLSLFHPLEGPRVLLREVRESDIDQGYHRWMNDPEVTRYLESRFAPISVEELADFVRKMASDASNHFLAIVVKRTGQHIGNIKLGPINWIHRTADIGLLIGEKDCWGQGYATEAIRCITNYAFDALHLHKVTASCYHTNAGSARAFLKAGFEQEGIRKSQFLCDRVYVDQILLGKWRIVQE